MVAVAQAGLLAPAPLAYTHTAPVAYAAAPGKHWFSHHFGVVYNLPFFSLSQISRSILAYGAYGQTAYAHAAPIAYAHAPG